MKEMWSKLTQPVLLQSFADEYDTNNKKKYETPLEANKTLEKIEPQQSLSEKEKRYFRSGVSKLLHLMHWSRPEVMNPVSELYRQISSPVEDHMMAKQRVVRYCLTYPKRG